jgi:leader peptidase (prepilin peptidase) / N-methyltransferase
MELNPNMTWFFYLSALLFGLVTGSFLNVVAWRWPREESIVFPGSHCPKCGKAISWYDNIPVLSWIFLGGKCRFCREKISARYPVIELLSGMLSVLCFWCFGPTRLFFIYYAFLAALFAASIIDLEHRLIPDEISIGGAVVGMGLAFLPGGKITPLPAVIGAVAGFLVLFVVAESYYLMTKREGMGLGDANLLAMIGAFLGWRSLPAVIFIGSAVGTVIGIFLIAASRDRLYKIPFGPFLSLGALCWVVIWSKGIHISLGPFGRFLGL